MLCFTLKMSNEKVNNAIDHLILTGQNIHVLRFLFSSLIIIISIPSSSSERFYQHVFLTWSFTFYARIMQRLCMNNKCVSHLTLLIRHPFFSLIYRISFPHQNLSAVLNLATASSTNNGSTWFEMNFDTNQCSCGRET